MKISRTGIELLKKWEGCRLKAYQDSVGVWTIGYGHTSAAGHPMVNKGLTITQDEAEEILVRDLVKYEAGVMKAITRAPTQAQFDAMTSLCFNIGQGAFAGSSIARKFNAGDIPGAADAFLMWNKAGGRELQGLTNRRKDERKLFLTPVNAAAKPVESVKPIPAPIPAPTPETPPVATPAPPDGGTGVAAVIIGAVLAAIAAVITMFFGGK